MTDARVGVDHDARADDMRAPAQVERLAVRGDAVVEAVQRVEQVDADEHAAGRDHEHVADRVVLLLVELTGLDQRHDDAGLVGPHADREEPARVVPLDELRADDAGVRPERLLDELTDRGGLERDVVVEEAEEACPFDELQRLVRRPGRSPGWSSSRRT